MRISLILLCFVLAWSQSIANKPFSKWQLDSEYRLNFEKEECLYNLSVDTVTNNMYQYRHTDILTDTNGVLIYSFRCFKNKIEIRNSEDAVVEEIQINENQYFSNNVSTVVLPFYEENKCLFLISENESSGEPSSLSFIEFDYGVSPEVATTPTKFSTAELKHGVISTTLNSNGDGYIIALSSFDLENMILIELKSDATYNTLATQSLDNGEIDNHSSGKKIKFSPQGDKIVVNNFKSIFHFFNFDNTSGAVSNGITIDMKKETGKNIRSEFAFSQDGTKLYSQSGHSEYIIHQFDLSKIDKNYILNSRIEIAEIEQKTCVDCLFYDFKLAPNNRIYITYSVNQLVHYTERKDKIHLGVIKCPNNKGLDTQFEFNEIEIPKYFSSQLHLQNIPTNFLSELQDRAEFERFKNLTFCKGTDVLIEATNDPCGEYKWIAPDGNRKYNRVLEIDNISENDEGSYFFNFNSCNQFYNDTFSIEIIDNLAPEIVNANENEIDLCKSPLDIIKLTTTNTYDNYQWYHTPQNSSVRTQLGTGDTLEIDQLGKIEVEVTNENGCTGIAEYNIVPPEIEMGEINELEFNVCRGGDVIFDLEYLIKSNVPVRIDSIKFAKNNSLYVANNSWLQVDYPDGVFDKRISVGYSSFSLGIERDTLEIHFYSGCYKTVRIPIKVIANTNQYTLEVPHLRTYVGARNFEIPIYLSMACVQEYTDLDLKATVSLSNRKYFIESTDGINVLNQWDDNQNTNIRFAYSNEVRTSGKVKIGSLYGVVLLTDIDSVAISLSDTNSNYLLVLSDGSLMTDSICVQGFRQVEFLTKDEIDTYVEGNTLMFESSGEYEGSFAISVIDYTGKELYKDSFDKHSGKMIKSISLSNISSGLYFIKIETHFGLVVKKLFLTPK